MSENELVGAIPPILGNLSYTGKLLVSSASPVFFTKTIFLSCLNTFWHLFFFRYLHGNKLTGHVPPELGNMTKLSYL